MARAASMMRAPTGVAVEQSEQSGQSASSSNPREWLDQGSNPSEKKMRLEVFRTSIAVTLKKENAMGMFGSDIPQLLHITEKD